MAGIIDKRRIKNIGVTIQKFQNITAENIDFEKLKDLFGKNGILVLACKLGYDTDTHFHKYATQIRAHYRSAKFLARAENIKKLQKNQTELGDLGSEIETLYCNIKDKLDKMRVGRNFDFLNYERLASEKEQLNLSIWDMNEPEDLDKLAAYRKLNAQITLIDDTLGHGFKGFLENYGLMCSKNTREMLSSRSQENWITKWGLLPIRVSWNLVWDGLRTVFATLLAPGEIACVELLTTGEEKRLSNDMKKLIALTKKANKTINNVQHGAEALLENAEQQCEFAKDVKAMADLMINSLKKDRKKDTDIRKCRMNVAVTIKSVAEILENDANTKLQSASQTN